MAELHAPNIRWLSRVDPLCCTALTGAFAHEGNGCAAFGAQPHADLCPTGVCYFLCAVTDGLWARWGTGAADLAAGHTLILLPRAKCDLRASAQFRGVLVAVAADWLTDLLRPMASDRGLVRLLVASAMFDVRFHTGVLHLECDAAEAARCQAECDCIGDLRSGPPACLTLATGALLKLLAYLNCALEREDRGAFLPLRQEIWRAADRIEEMVLSGTPFDLAATAALVGMNAIQFARQFRAVVGKAPMEYYQERRILWSARLLLEDETATITDISHRLGFADTPHFSRRFKSTYGLSPGEFRRRAQDSTTGK